MKYLELVRVYEDLERTSGRLDKVNILSKLLKKGGKELKDVVYLIQGRVFSRLDERKLGMSSRLILKVMSHVVGIKIDEVEKEWRKKGDLGNVVEELLKRKRQKTLGFKELTVEKVVNNIRKLSELEGKGTVNKKVQLVSELLNNAQPEEGKFIVRTVLEDLRIGVAEGVLRDAIAKAFEVDVKDVEKTHNVLVDYGEIAEKAKEKKLDKIDVSVGKPIKVMLAILVKDVEEGFKSVGKPSLWEFKYDGFRLGIHKKGNEIKLFTRRMEDVSKQFPDIVKVVKEHVEGSSCIIDCEAVGIDENGRYLPFQKISQRIKRKYDIEGMSKRFPVELNVFDVLYYNGKSLMNEELKERRKILKKIIKEKKKKIVLTESLETDNEKKALEFYKKAVSEGLEGVMIKNLKSNYKPGRYVNGWVKLKHVLEPLDLVIVGAEYGTGKRGGLLSSFDLACRKDDKFLKIGKVGTGIKEKTEGVTFRDLTKELKPCILEIKGKKVKVKPKVVVEVIYEEIQKSVNYESGYALRFPRLVRIRDDKRIDDVNTLSEVENIFGKQRGGK